jgi:hypothetical protein
MSANNNRINTVKDILAMNKNKGKKYPRTKINTTAHVQMKKKEVK